MFSDKTGTLTSNEMQLRELAIKGANFGSSKFRWRLHPDKHGRGCFRASACPGLAAWSCGCSLAKAGFQQGVLETLCPVASYVW